PVTRSAAAEPHGQTEHLTAVQHAHLIVGLRGRNPMQVANLECQPRDCQRRVVTRVGFRETNEAPPGARGGLDTDLPHVAGRRRGVLETGRRGRGTGPRTATPYV